MADPSALGFVAPAKLGADEPEQDVFAQLLAGVEDDGRAVEPTDDDLGTLEMEWEKLERMDHALDRAKDRVKVLSAELESQKNRMQLAMKREGTKQFRGSSGGACVVAEHYTTSLEDEPRFMAWVKESHPELLVVHSKTRTKFIRENFRDRGIPLDDPAFPPGLKAGTVDVLQVRGIKPPATQGD